jgi:hypothetical protein
MSYKRINNITGWVVCIIACTVYLLTMEKNGSLWDCGEFASSAYKLQIPHSPGAPFFVLLGRLFMAPFGPENAAIGINGLSAISSGFTVLFLFWTITHFAKKLISKSLEELNSGQITSIMAAGVVGGLALTFSDTFWYDAVEAEVYALSSFFTALIFWLMVKWENEVTAEQARGIAGHFTRADRYIVVIFFLMGLSIGVHLLNLLTIPAMGMMYYYKRYTVSTRNTIIAFIVSCIITGLALKALIQWTIKGAGNFDIFFVNTVGLPYFSGFVFFFIMLAAIVWVGLKIAAKNNWNLLKLSLWCFSFIALGVFASYSTTLIRSNANVAVDMNEVDNPVSLMSYLTREQYGDWPILYGQDFTAQIKDSKVTETFVKADGEYKEDGKKVEYIYDDADMHFLPRMWDQGNEQGHADYYVQFAGINKLEKKSQDDPSYDRAPTVGENISFMLSYQFNWMYWRYFMWNFAGKQNDVQGVNMANVRDGNWKTGIGFYDSMRLGDQDKLPDSLKNNKANNKLFMLPFLLGVLGFIYQANKNKRDLLVVATFFAFTGLAIAFYLNMAAPQPRERDYAFVGSYYVFAIWIGLGVMYVAELLNGFLKNQKTAALAAGLVCGLLVPANMAKQEWDDHDRSQKTMAPSLAKDYLESCAPNAILFTFGDNDTYPLWYAQEVLGIRKDVRVMNTSLLGTDWYINQLRYKVNDSDPVDVIWTPEQIRGSHRDITYNAPIEGVDPASTMDLYTMMKDYAGSDDPRRTRQSNSGETMNIFPCKRVSIPVDVNFVQQNGTVNKNDSVLSTVNFEIPKSYLYKNDAAILNVIAANKWKRPIYFTSPYGELGFQNYLRQDGLSYRLVPVMGSDVNKDWVMDKMMTKFEFGGAEKASTYFDEENRRHLNSLRLGYAGAASSLADGNRKEDAKKLLNKVDQNINVAGVPYGMPSRQQQHNQIALQMLMAAYRAGDEALIKKISTSLKTDMQQQVAYYESLSENRRDGLSQEIQRNEYLMKGLMQIEQEFGPKAPVNREAPRGLQNAPPPPPMPIKR